MKLLAVAASLRRDSLNRKLIHLAAALARDAGWEVDLADFHEFDMPLYELEHFRLLAIMGDQRDLTQWAGQGVHGA